MAIENAAQLERFMKREVERRWGIKFLEQPVRCRQCRNMTVQVSQQKVCRVCIQRGEKS